MVKHDVLSILEVITKSSEYLKRKGISNYKIDAEWLVAFALGCKRMELYLRFGEILPHHKLAEIKALVMERGLRVPLQHILGQVQFTGLKLKSDHRALVPRFETEFLVDYLYQRLTPEFNGKIADLGCGSGAIILGLCSMMPKSSGDGFDNSHQALTLAKENLVLCKLENRVCFKNFDWLKNKKLQEKYDLVVSNPPYLSIEEWSECEPEVKIYDPKGALVSEKDGLCDLESVISVASKSLKKNGYLALEFGQNQADLVSDLLSAHFTAEIISDQYLVRRFALAVRK